METTHKKVPVVHEILKRSADRLIKELTDIIDKAVAIWTEVCNMIFALIPRRFSLNVFHIFTLTLSDFK